jgi:hypothetical protein
MEPMPGIADFLDFIAQCKILRIRRVLSRAKPNVEL